MMKSINIDRHGVVYYEDASCELFRVPAVNQCTKLDLSKFDGDTHWLQLNVHPDIHSYIYVHHNDKVVTYDRHGNNLLTFTWKKEDLDPLLIFRLYQIYGITPIPNDELADELKDLGYNCVSLRYDHNKIEGKFKVFNNGFAENVEVKEPIDAIWHKHTELVFEDDHLDVWTTVKPGSKIHQFHPRIKFYQVKYGQVTLKDENWKLLFTWKLPEVKKELDPVLVSRLFDVYGEKLFMSDLLGDPTNPRAVNIRRDGDKLRVGKRVIDYVPSRVKHTDVEICNLLAKSPRGILVVITDVSILKAFYSEIESYRIDDGYVTMYDIKGRKLFAWMLSPGKPAVTRKEIEDLQKMYGTELFSLRKGPKQVAEWSEKNFPHVNYLRVCDGSLAGYKYYEPVFSIDIEKLCE